MSNEQTLKKQFECLAIASPSFCKNKLLIDEAQKLAKNLRLNSSGERLAEGELIKFILDSGADALIIGTDPLTETVLRAAPKLKAIGKYGVGLDRVDLNAIESRNIFFGYEAGVNKRSVSELTLGYMLGHQRNIFKSLSRMQQATWSKHGGSHLSEKTIGIVGFGHIGSDLAELLQPFRCKLLVHDILDKRDEARRLNATQTSYHELLKHSDIISFHVPGTPATKLMFAEAEIRLSKMHALIINTARSMVVDFDAIIEAVRSSRLGGFASDVFPNEPLVSRDYKIEDGFYFTPHIGGNAEEAVLNMGRAALAKLRYFLNQ